ncbi:MAG: response regulator [Pedobacter sp.]|nr:response regulator [Pedobacter sp.]
MKKRISVLEDDQDLRDMFTILLEGEGYQVETFATVASFNQGLEQNLPDLFILDVRLPDGNGMEVCKLVKSAKETSNIPVIVMSAHRNFDRQISTCTAEAYVAKPFEITSLIGQIRQLLGKN